MKAVSPAIAFSMLVLVAGAVTGLAATGPKPPDKKLVVPEGTEFKLRLHTPIDSKTSEVGDRITASLVTPTYVDNEIAFPKGTRVEGYLTSVKPAAHRGRGGTVTPIFNYVEFADGRKLSILGTLTEVYPNKHSGDVQVDMEGDLRGRGPSHLMQTALVAGAAATGGIGGIGIGIAAGVGGLFGAIFIPRGHEAVLGAGSMIGMRLARNTVLPRQAPQPIALRSVPEKQQKN